MTLPRTRHLTTKGRQHHMVPLERMVDESIAFIREHEPPEGYFVGFSGGKDSIVTLELVRMSGVKHEAWYAATGLDPKEVVRFIRTYYPDVLFAYPKRSFWSVMDNRVPPTRKARWCCDVLKKNPTKDNPLRHRLMGLRAEESRARRMRPMIETYKKSQTIYKPIFHWREWHVWEFIDHFHLSYPIVYDMGFHRVGCVICPFHTRLQHQQYRQHWPQYFEIFEKKVRKWWTGEQPMLKRLGISTPEQFLEFWYNDKTPCKCPSNDCAGAGK